MINITLESLLQFMRKNHYTSDIQTDTQQIYTIFKIHQKEYPLFLRIFDEGHLLQLLVFIPCHIKSSERFVVHPHESRSQSKEPNQEHEKQVICDLARLLHLLNKELDLPGFGLDEMAGAVFYRLMLPTPKHKIDGDLLLAFIKTVEHVCQMFSQPIEAVGSGQMTLDQILAKAQEIEKK